MFDVHTHALRLEHWGHEWDDHWKPIYQHDWVDVTPEAYDQAMREGGVDHAAVFGLTADAVGMSTPNEFIRDFDVATSTKTYPFAALDPSGEGAIEKLRHAIDLGLRGLKLYPVLGLYDIREECFDEFYRIATEAGLVLLWHMGATPSPVGSLALSNPLLVDEVARRHPGLVQVIAHLGHPWQRETMVVLRKNRRVFSDISAAWARPVDGHRALIRAAEWGAVDKLLFGSDYPMWTPAEAVAGLKQVASTKVEGMPAVSTDLVDWLLNGDPREVLGLE
ncbi:amidohydrolase family protein [Aestuariimicrobium soli]|uniref:amidohydrolase family protein n=1 Tax=Aestuariimicrobium soli TaxID=2035834 RepID=UPI003EBB7EE3